MMDANKLRELALAATEGPWIAKHHKIDKDCPNTFMWMIHAPEGVEIPNDTPALYLNAEDAALIVAMRNSILELLDALKEIGELQRFKIHKAEPGKDFYELMPDDDGDLVLHEELQAILDNLLRSKS